MRDDFSEKVKRNLAGGVGHRCSNPGCRQPTSGPSASGKTVTNVGVAAHITAASPGGPRYDASLDTEQRAAECNGVWLCQKCGKAVDDDPAAYDVKVLRDWRKRAESSARKDIERGPVDRLPDIVNAAVYFGPNAVSISGENAVVLESNAISISGPVVCGATDRVDYGSGLPGMPDRDGLYRIDGREICPECLRTKGVTYFLDQQMIGGGAYGDGIGEMTYVDAEPTDKWECTVCGSVYSQKRP